VGTRRHQDSSNLGQSVSRTYVGGVMVFSRTLDEKNDQDMRCSGRTIRGVPVETSTLVGNISVEKRVAGLDTF
jgi:hypothetical protein